MWIALILILYGMGVGFTYSWMEKVYIHLIPPATEKEMQEAWYLIIVGSALFPLTWLIYMMIVGRE